MTAEAPSIQLSKIEFKAKILQAGILKQQHVIDDFQKRVKEIMTGEAIDKDEYDSHQQSFKSETMTEVSLLSDQLHIANHELDELKHPIHIDLQRLARDTGGAGRFRGAPAATTRQASGESSSRSRP